jgi:hypothetical protein
MRSCLALSSLVVAVSVVACRPSHSDVSDSSATSGTPNAALSDSSATSGTPQAVGIKRDSLRRADSIRRADSARATKRP